MFLASFRGIKTIVFKGFSCWSWATVRQLRGRGIIDNSLTVLKEMN